MRNLRIAGVAFGWTTLVLVGDGSGSLTEQRLFGVATWLLLVAFLVRESALVRTQVAVVIVIATAVEYTFSPVLGVYSYRFDNVPAYVPPGHGLVYLCALAIGRTGWVHRHRIGLRTGVVLGGGAYAGWGLVLADRPDVLGALWFACLVGFLYLGRSQTLYLGAFAIVTYLELVGTWAGTWAWSTHDPTGMIPIGNPPSGAAGGYAWFDLAAIYAAPVLLSGWSSVFGSRLQMGQGRGVHQAVAGQGAAAVRTGPATQIGEHPARLGHDQRQRGQVVQRDLRFGGDVDGALGQ